MTAPADIRGGDEQTISLEVTDIGRVISDWYVVPSSTHTAGLDVCGVQLKRQRVDDARSVGIIEGVSMGVKPEPLMVTTVPPETGPPVGSILSTTCWYCKKR